MESEILKAADYAVQQPGVTGYICVDQDGLCIAAKGQASESMSGIVRQIADLASKIEDTNTSTNANTKNESSPVVRVDLDHYRMLIQSRDSITSALISPQK